MAIRIFTDACADLSPEFAEKYGVTVLPLTVNMGELSFSYNGIERYEGDRSMDEFYDAVRNHGALPTTAQITPEYAERKFREALEAGDDVLYLAVSTGISGCYNSGCIARNGVLETNPEWENRISVVDTLCASLGQACLINMVAREIAKGADLAAVTAWIEANKMSVQHSVTVDDLNHLHRSGRLSGASAFLGTMLTLKPIILISKIGKLETTGKVIGRQKAMRAVVDQAAADYCGDPESPVYIIHGDCQKDAETLAKLAEKKLGRKVDMITRMGPVIASHGGPGIMGLFYVSKTAERKV